MISDLKGIYICDMGISKLKDASTTMLTTVSKSPVGTYTYITDGLFFVDQSNLGKLILFAGL